MRSLHTVPYTNVENLTSNKPGRFLNGRDINYPNLTYPKMTYFTHFDVRFSTFGFAFVH